MQSELRADPNFEWVVPLANHIARIKQLANNSACVMARSAPQPMRALFRNIFSARPIVLKASLY